MSDSAFSPEEIAKGQEVTAYYQQLDETEPNNQPTDDETKTQPPFPQLKKKETSE